MLAQGYEKRKRIQAIHVVYDLLYFSAQAFFTSENFISANAHIKIKSDGSERTMYGTEKYWKNEEKYSRKDYKR